MRSLRSKERDLLHSPIDHRLVAESPQTKLNSTEEDETPSKDVDEATGVYLGQLDDKFKNKQGIGV